MFHIGPVDPRNTPIGVSEGGHGIGAVALDQFVLLLAAVGVVTGSRSDATPPGVRIAAASPSLRRSSRLCQYLVQPCT